MSSEPKKMGKKKKEVKTTSPTQSVTVAENSAEQMSIEETSSKEKEKRGKKRKEHGEESEDELVGEYGEIRQVKTKRGQVIFDPPYSLFKYPKSYKSDHMGVLSSGWVGIGVVVLVACGFFYVQNSNNIPDWAGERLLLSSYCTAFKMASILSWPWPYITRGRVSRNDAMNWILDLFFKEHVFDNDPHVRITDVAFDGVPVKVFTPVGLDDNTPGIFYIHGGGFIWLSADAYTTTTYNLALRSQMVVVSVDYRLAPTHPYPAAFEDCLKAAKYFLRKGLRYGVDPERIAIMGDSAGGNLAAAVALRLARERAEGEETAVQLPALKQQVLIYPATQMLDFNTPSYQAFATTSWLSKKMAIGMFLSYLGFPELLDRWEEFAVNNHTSSSFKKSAQAGYLNTKVLPEEFMLEGTQEMDVNAGNDTLWRQIKSRLLDPYLCPLMAEDKHLALLPPSYFVLAQNDILRDDGLLYAKRLKNAGVDIFVDFHEKMAHGFMLLSPVSHLQFQAGLQGHLQLANYLRKNL